MPIAMCASCQRRKEFGVCTGRDRREVVRLGHQARRVRLMVLVSTRANLLTAPRSVMSSAAVDIHGFTGESSLPRGSILFLSQWGERPVSHPMR